MNRFIRLNFGLFLYALGIQLTINANIGYPPWDIFHAGLAKTADISIGAAIIIAGLAIGILDIILGERVGIGTILNMTLIGVFYDLINWFDIIPVMSHFVVGLIMLVIGLFTISIATYFYIGSGFGAGPRDSLMIALNKRLKLPIGACRIILELMAITVGWVLGGQFGFGTIIAAVLVGFCVQTTFSFFKFDPKEIKHETILDTYQTLKNSSESI